MYIYTHFPHNKFECIKNIYKLEKPTGEMRSIRGKGQKANTARKTMN